MRQFLNTPALGAMAMALASTCARGQVNSLSVFEDTDFDMWHRFHTVTCPDGGALTHRNGANTNLSRYDANGIPLWHRVFPIGVSSVEFGQSFASDGANGAFIGGIGPWSMLGQFGDFVADTIFRNLSVAHIDPQGNVAWSQALQSAMIVQPFAGQNDFAPWYLDMAYTPGGNLFLLTGRPASLQGMRWELIALDPASGAALWTRDLTDQMYSMDVFVESIESSMVPASDGSLAIVINSHAKALRLDANGNLLWMNQYTYAGLLAHTFSDAINLADGRILTTAWVNGTNGPQLVLTCLNLDGTINKSILMDAEPYGAQAVQLPSGGLAIATGGYQYDLHVLELDTAGGPVVRCRMVDVTSGASVMEHRFWKLTNEGDEMMLSLTTSLTDTVFTTSEAWPSMSRVVGSFADQCMMSIDTIEALLIPPGVVQQTPVTTGASTPLPWPYLHTPVPLAYTDTVPYPTWDACAWLGLDESIGTVPPPLIFPNPAAAGMGVTIHGNAADDFTVHDALGRRVDLRGSSTSSTMLSTQYLTSGLYVVTGRDRAMRTLWSVKLVVE